MNKIKIIKLASALCLATLLPTQTIANSYGQGNGTNDPSVNYLELTPAMVGITSARNNVSVNNVDVSAHFNLAQGSIKVSFDSVDTLRKRNGRLAFSLAGDGDNDASWHIDYASDRPIKLSHGGSLAGSHDDMMVANDGKRYSFNSTLTNGLTHKVYGNTYKVHNHYSSKLNNNRRPFEWVSNSKAKAFDFDFRTNANSASGKGSDYKVFVDNAEVVTSCELQTICADTHFSLLTPAMVGINQEGLHLSGNNIDVSEHFGLDEGSVKVSFSSVDTIRKNGVLQFTLAGSGDQKASWEVVYSEKRPLKLSHGGALDGRRTDNFTAVDGQKYLFSNNLTSGLRAYTSGNRYGVRNNKKRKSTNNRNPFEWTSTNTSMTYKFDFGTTARSRSGSGSSYKIYIDDSSCENILPENCEEEEIVIAT